MNEIKLKSEDYRALVEKLKQTAAETIDSKPEHMKLVGISFHFFDEKSECATTTSFYIKEFNPKSFES